MRFVLAALFMFMLSGPVWAAATDWQEVAPGTEVRLISSDVRTGDGTTLVGLEVSLAPETKTYWRVPGETGIPLDLDFTGSRAISGYQTLWPMPQREIAGGFVDHVYYGRIVIPIELRITDSAPRVELSLVMGVCSDICVPVDAAFELDLELGEPDTANELRIEQALAEVPVPWNGAADAFGPVGADPETGDLAVAVSSGEVDADSIIAATADPGLVYGPPKKSPIDETLSFERLGWGATADMAGRQVTLIFHAPDGPYMVTRTVVGIEQVAGTP